MIIFVWGRAFLSKGIQIGSFLKIENAQNLLGNGFTTLLDSIHFDTLKKEDQHVRRFCDSQHQTAQPLMDSRIHIPHLFFNISNLEHFGFLKTQAMTIIMAKQTLCTATFFFKPYLLSNVYLGSTSFIRNYQQYTTSTSSVISRVNESITYYVKLYFTLGSILNFSSIFQSSSMRENLSLQTTYSGQGYM